MGYSVRRASLIFTGLSLTRSVINLAVLPLLVVLVSQEQLGLILMLTPLWWLGQSLLTLGANEGLARAAVREPAGMGSAALLSAAGSAGLCLLTVGVLAVASPWLLGIDFGPVVALSVLVALNQSVVSTSVGILRNVQALRGATVVLALGTLVPPILGILLTLASADPTATTYLTGIWSGSLLAAVVGLAFVTRRFSFGLRLGARLLVAGVRLGLPLIPQLIGAMLVDFGARRLVLHVGGLDDVAVLGVALAVAGAIATVSKSAFLAWSPRFFTYPADQAMPAARAFTVTVVLVVCVLQAAAISVLVVGFEVVASSGLPATALLQATAICSTAAPLGVPLLALTYVGLHQERTGLLGVAVLIGSAAAVPVTIALANVVDWSLAGAASSAAALFSAMALARLAPGLEATRLWSGPMLVALGASTTFSLLIWFLARADEQSAILVVAATFGLAALAALARRRHDRVSVPGISSRRRTRQRTP